MLKWVLVLGSVFPFLAACSSEPRSFEARGPAAIISSAEDDIPNINEGLSARDYRLLTSVALRSLEKRCPASRNVPHLISNFENQTATDLDIALLRRELVDTMHGHGYAMIDSAARSEIAGEIAYEQLGYTDPAQAIVKGRQSSTRYLVRTVINSRSETGDNNKFTRYRLSLQFVNSETADLECVGAAEIRKDYWRQRKGW